MSATVIPSATDVLKWRYGEKQLSVDDCWLEGGKAALYYRGEGGSNEQEFPDVLKYKESSYC